MQHRNRFAPLAGSAAAVVLVTAAIFLLRDSVPVLSLGSLYVLAVLPVAILWGRIWAVLVAIASMLAFNFSSWSRCTRSACRIAPTGSPLPSTWPPRSRSASSPPGRGSGPPRRSSASGRRPCSESFRSPCFRVKASSTSFPGSGARPDPSSGSKARGSSSATKRRRGDRAAGRPASHRAARSSGRRATEPVRGAPLPPRARLASCRRARPG